jgi:DNA-binding NarL/FixJ family response regulator
MEDADITRVVLADDHFRVRAGIRHLLEKAPDIAVIGEASDGIEALHLVETLAPDVLLLDMEMPKMNGKQVAQILQEKESPVRILVLSAYNDRQYILGMLENGAAGYLTKDEVPEILIKAVRGVARGEQGWISRRVAAEIASWSPDSGLDQKTLTLREMDILRLLVRKKTDQEIIEELNISEKMLSKHIEILCIKLRASSRVELIVRTTQENIQ